MMPRNKLLAGSFAISFVLNAFFLILLGNSDLFQHADAIHDLRAEQIIVFKPPVFEKPKPTPKVTPPPVKHNVTAHPIKMETKRPVAPQPPPPVQTTVYQAQKQPTEHPTAHAAVFVKAQPPQPRSRPDPFVPLPPHVSVSPAPHPAVDLRSHSSQGTVPTPPSPAPVFHPDPSPAPAPQAEMHPEPAPEPAPV